MVSMPAPPSMVSSPAPPVMVSAPPRLVPTTVMRLLPVRPAALIVTPLVMATDGADLKVVLRAVAVGVGGRDLAVRHRQVEAGGVDVEGDGVDIGDGGEGGQVIGAGRIQPQRVDRAGLRRAVDGLAGGKMRDGADDKDVGAQPAGQDIGTRPAGDGILPPT